MVNLQIPQKMKVRAMKAVMAVIPPDILAWRRRTGADHYDEMWEGVLHMNPQPSPGHQEFEGALETYLRIYWARPRSARIMHNVAVAPVGGWPKSYRAPDLALIAPDRFSIRRKTHLEGPPSVVIEIRSPNDESYEKLAFYEALGVPEVWIIDRDTKQPEIYILRSGRYVPQVAVDGWYRSDETGAEMRIGQPGKLAIRMAGDDSTREELSDE